MWREGGGATPFLANGRLQVGKGAASALKESLLFHLTFHRFSEVGLSWSSSMCYFSSEASSGCLVLILSQLCRFRVNSGGPGGMIEQEAKRYMLLSMMLLRGLSKRSLRPVTGWCESTAFDTETRKICYQPVQCAFCIPLSLSLSSLSLL